MILKNTEEFRLSFELENMRVYITLYCGFFHLRGGHSVVHSHNNYEFQMMLEGSVRLQTETCGHVLQAKEACIIAPNVVHSCILGKTQNMKTSFCFFFEKINKRYFGKFSRCFLGSVNVVWSYKYIFILTRLPITSRISHGVFRSCIRGVLVWFLEISASISVTGRRSRN